MITRWIKKIDLTTPLPDGDYSFGPLAEDLFTVEGGKIVDLNVIGLGDEPEEMAAAIRTLLSKATSGEIEVEVVCLDYDDGWWGWRMRGEVGGSVRMAWLTKVDWAPWGDVQG